MSLDDKGKRPVMPRVFPWLHYSFFCGSLMIAGASALRCDLCGQSIRGRYYVAGTYRIAGSCMARYPKCPGCGLPVRNGGGSYQSRTVCRDCAVRQGKCANCGDILLGRYYETKGEPGRYCETCFNKKPRCSRCNLPVPGLQAMANGYFCSRCLKNAALHVVRGAYQWQMVRD